MSTTVQTSIKNCETGFAFEELHVVAVSMEDSKAELLLQDTLSWYCQQMFSSLLLVMTLPLWFAEHGSVHLEIEKQGSEILGVKIVETWKSSIQNHKNIIQ